MESTFDWDETKATDNLPKHGVGFQEAITVFQDPLLVTLSDTEHSDFEERYWNIGHSTMGRLLVVVFTDRDAVIRIISARRANREERRIYENENIA